MLLINESASLFGRDSSVDINEGNYTVESFGAHRIIRESYEDMVGILESMARIDALELQYMKEGVDVDAMYVSEGFKDRFDQAIEKIKDFIKKVWEKIKTFFKNMLVLIRSIFMKADDFVKKYSKELNAVSGKKVKVTGYKYTLDKYDADAVKLEDKDISKIFTTDIKFDDLDKKIEAIENGREARFNEVRSNITGFRSTEETYSDDLFKKFRDGTDVEKEIEISVSDAIKVCKDKELLKAANDYEKILEENIKKVNDLVKKYESKLGGEAPTPELGKKRSKILQIIQKVASNMNTEINISLKALTAYKSAYDSRLAQAKAVCSSALRGKYEK